MSPSSFIVDMLVPTWSVGEKGGRRDHGMRLFVGRRNEGADSRGEDRREVKAPYRKKPLTGTIENTT